MAATALILPPTTPPDYHRIISPTLQIPSDPAVTIPVGLLSCQRDPLLRSLSTTIISTAFVKPTPPSPVGNSGKKCHTKQAKASAPPAPSEPILQVITHDTVLFPEGGGQPHDVGLLTAENGDIWDVAFVKRHGGVAVHYLKVKEGVNDVPAHLGVGRKVELTLGDEGLKRRLDHMSMHTAQHLLSAVIETRLSLPTLAWSLTTYPSPSYVDLPRPLTAIETALVQDTANRFVFEGRRVHIEVEELRAGQQGIDSGEADAGTGSARELGRGLPKDYTGGVHRVVVIDGVDRNPCCGTHLPTLSSLQLFLFPAPASSSSGPARHYFLSGPRLLNYIGTTQLLLARTSNLLSCGAVETPDRVALVLDESKKREKRVEDIERELGDALGRRLADEMLEWQRNGHDDVEWTKYVGRTDDASSALSFLQSIASAFVAHLPPATGSAAHRYALLLTSSPSSQTSTSTTVVMLIGSEDKRVKEIGDELKKQFKTLKGGGRGARWSGKSVGVWLEEREGKIAALALTQTSPVP